MHENTLAVFYSLKKSRMNVIGQIYYFEGFEGVKIQDTVWLERSMSSIMDRW